MPRIPSIGATFAACSIRRARPAFETFIYIGQEGG